MTSEAIGDLRMMVQQNYWLGLQVIGCKIDFFADVKKVATLDSDKEWVFSDRKLQYQRVVKKLSKIWIELV